MLIQCTPSESFLSPSLQRFFRTDSDIQQGDLVPRCDILEEKDLFAVYVEMPGVLKEDLKVKYEDKLLVIEGEKKIHNPQNSESFCQIERRCGTYRRSFRLGEEIDAQRIGAKYENGVLHLTLPKTEAAQLKSIEVKVA